MTRKTRIGMAALCSAVAALAGLAAGLGVFARGGAQPRARHERSG